MFLPWIYLCGLILLPILGLSSIPAVYPIYKVLIAPHLPLSIQNFFTDLKTLLLTLLSFCISGSLTNHLTIPNSLEDWVYLYLRQCNPQSSFSSFCLSCSSPAISMQFHFSSEVCSVCDICLLDLSQHEVPFFEDNGCSQILRDVKQITSVGQANGGSVTFMNVMKECVATFGLYIQFNFHLLFRALIRFIISVARIAKYICMFYKWLLQEVVENYEIDRTRVVAILFICLLTSILLLYTIRISVRLFTILSRILMSILPSTKSRSRLHLKQANHIHPTKPSFPAPEKTSTKMEFNSEIIHQQTPSSEDDWSILFQENSDLAGVVSLSVDNPEVMEMLMDLIVFLYGGISLIGRLICRSCSLIPLSQYCATNPISLRKCSFRKRYHFFTSSNNPDSIYSYELRCCKSRSPFPKSE